MKKEELWQSIEELVYSREEFVKDKLTLTMLELSKAFKTKSGNTKVYKAIDFSGYSNFGYAPKVKDLEEQVRLGTDAAGYHIILKSMRDFKEAKAMNETYGFSNWLEGRLKYLPVAWNVDAIFANYLNGESLDKYDVSMGEYELTPVRSISVNYTYDWRDRAVFAAMDLITKGSSKVGKEEFSFWIKHNSKDSIVKAMQLIEEQLTKNPEKDMEQLERMQQDIVCLNLNLTYVDILRPYLKETLKEGMKAGSLLHALCIVDDIWRNPMNIYKYGKASSDFCKVYN